MKHVTHGAFGSERHTNKRTATHHSSDEDAVQVGGVTLTRKLLSTGSQNAPAFTRVWQTHTLHMSEIPPLMEDCQ